MKINVIYGAGIAALGAALTLVLFAMGAHSDVEKMRASSSIAGFIGFIIPVVGVFLAIRATRAASPGGGLTYGKGVLTALLVGLVSGVLGGIFNFVYTAFINPDMVETVRAIQLETLEESGLSQQQIDATAGIMRIMTSPAVTSTMAVLFTPVYYTVIGLIAAAILKREAVSVPPPIVQAS